MTQKVTTVGAAHVKIVDSRGNIIFQGIFENIQITVREVRGEDFKGAPVTWPEII